MRRCGLLVHSRTSRRLWQTGNRSDSMKTAQFTIPATIALTRWSASTRRQAIAAPRTKKQILLGLVLSLAVLVPWQTLQAAGPAPVNLGSTAHFTILSGAAITYPGSGTINGDIGAYPITGAAIHIPASVVNGTVYASDATYPLGASVDDPVLLLAAKSDLTIAYGDAAGRTPVPVGLPFLNPGGGNIGGMNLAPGLYKFTTTAVISGSDVTLTGGADDVWIFQVGTSLGVEAGVNRKVILAGGAQARNVFWQVGTSATLGTYSVFKGTIIADQSITMDVGSTMEGRALAFSGQVAYSGSGGSLPNNGPLTIVSAHGIGLLPVGVYTNMYNTTLTNAITGLETIGGTQYVAAGWTLAGGVDTNGQMSGIATNMTMVQTNTATLTWLWTTNYALNASADPNGSVTGSTNGWYLAGSSVTVTSAPNPGYTFAGWTGDVTGPTNNAVQTMTMDQARTAVANFVVATGPTQTLTIVSEHGIGLPVAGIYFTGSGDTLTNRITGVETIGGTQYVSAGWTLTGGVDTNGQILGSMTNMVLVQTNSAVLTWLWTTNYALNASAGLNGSLTGSTNGWYLAGSSVTVTSAPNPGYLFAGWTGDVPPGSTNNAIQTMTMDQARTAMAHFVPGPAVDVTLTIVSEHGTGLPPVGVHTNGGNSTLTNSITSTQTIGGTQYVATGWSMTGNGPIAGSGTNMMMIQTNNAVLTWLWSTNYWLAISTNGSGSVTPTNGWHAAGGIVILTATPGITGSSVGWSGDTNGCIVVGATLAVPMNRARAITAVFAGSVPTISGKVTKSGTSTGVTNVLITLTGGGLATTDASGNSTCHVPVGWSGIATPSSGTGGTFAPTSKSYSKLTANSTGQNYIWTPTPANPKISGKVTQAGTSTGIAGVQLIFTSGGGTVTTDAGGNYSNVVAYGWSGTVTPTNPAGGAFSPKSKSYSKVIANATGQNYVWTPPPTGQKIEGMVIPVYSLSKVGVIVLTFSGVGSTVANKNGSYTMIVPYGWSGTVTPSATLRGNFAPAYRSYSNVIANKTGQNFSWKEQILLPAPQIVSDESVAIAPAVLLRTSGTARWSGKNANLARRASELLSIAINDGAPKITLPVAVADPRDLSVTVEIDPSLQGVVEPAGEAAVIFWNAGGTVTTGSRLPGATLIGSVLFVPIGDNVVLTWDLTLLKP